MSKLSSALILGLLVLAVSGCTRNWGLKVTEVGKRTVELHLKSDPSNSLLLTNMTLHWEGDGAPGDTVALSTLGRAMVGGEFLIIWEDGGHSGAPVLAPYTQGTLPSVPGIKVRNGFFAQMDNVPSAIRISGSWRNNAGVTHKIDDTVRFGSPVGDRPTLGTFTNDGSLGNPSGSGSFGRKWDSGAPVDTNAESDWKGGPLGIGLIHSYGLPTPP